MLVHVFLDQQPSVQMAKNAVRTLIQTHGRSDASLQPELILLFSGLDDGESVCIDNIGIP